MSQGRYKVVDLKNKILAVQRFLGCKTLKELADEISRLNKEAENGLEIESRGLYQALRKWTSSAPPEQISSVNAKALTLAVQAGLGKCFSVETLVESSLEAFEACLGIRQANDSRDTFAHLFKTLRSYPREKLKILYPRFEGVYYRYALHPCMPGFVMVSVSQIYDIDEQSNCFLVFDCTADYVYRGYLYFLSDDVVWAITEDSNNFNDMSTLFCKVPNPSHKLHWMIGIITTFSPDVLIPSAFKTVVKRCPEPVEAELFAQPDKVSGHINETFAERGFIKREDFLSLDENNQKIINILEHTDIPGIVTSEPCNKIFDLLG